MKATKKLLTVVPISSATQPQPVYTHSQLMGRGSETLLKVPISEEVERTKLSIKQKAAELTKKTRGSFRRKNGVSGGGADDRAGSMAFPVVEFSRQGYKIRKVFS